MVAILPKSPPVANQQEPHVPMTRIQPEIVGKTIKVPLPPILNIASSEALRVGVLDVLTPETKLALDSEHVEQLTTPGIQMLLAVADCAARKETAFTITNPSQALIEAFRDAGLFSQLMAWDIE